MINKYTKRKLHPRGITSLLVVSAIALVFSTIIVGLTSLSIKEAKQALSNDLSNRALAAAVSSAQDASAWVKDNPGKQYPNCDGTGQAPTTFNPTTANVKGTSLIKYDLTSSSQTNYKTSIVCRTVTISTNTPTGQINKDQTVEFFTFLPNGPGATKLNLKWGTNKKALTVAESDMYPVYPDTASLINYPVDAAASIEISAVYWPSNGNTQAYLPINSSLIVPTSTPKDLSISNYITGSCSTYVKINDYACNVTVDLGHYTGTDIPSNDKIIVILRSRYKNTDYQAQFFDSSNKPLTVNPSQAIIDVTAKVGNYYRRIRAEKPLQGSSYINDVLYSSKNICKNMTAVDDGSFSLASGNNCP